MRVSYAAYLIVTGFVFKLSILPASAQSLIVPDETLGEERSQVIQNANGAPTEAIAGGARRGQNLFHSFEEFNVDTGREATFLSPAGLENIFSRVTGGNASNILGTLSTSGAAAPDLYLMNPNGIVFGPNASLDVEGSFAAVTADGIQFGDEIFSASAPEVPSALLTVDPSAFLFSQLPAGSIINTSVAPAGSNTTLGVASGLRVPDDHSLILLGGDVTLDGSQSLLASGGNLNAFGGRIEIGSLSDVGTVELTVEGERLSLEFPEAVARGDVSIDGARIDVLGDGGGDIAIHGRSVDILPNSILVTGTGAGLGSVDSQVGDISVDATGALTVDESLIGSLTFSGVGSSGDVQIAAESVDLLNGSIVLSSSLGQGNAGSISIRAEDVITFAGRNASGSPSGVISGVISADQIELPEGIVISDGAAVGDSGDVTLEASQLIVEDGAISTAVVAAEADAGDIRITASDSVRLAGEQTTIDSATLAQGDAGDIDIMTSSLEVSSGATLTTSTRGQGDAGDVLITASDRVTLAGTSPDGQSPSAAFSTVEEGGVGQGGNIEITTPVLEITGGAGLTASTRGQGDAGNVLITASDRVTFAGTNADGQLFSGVTSAVGETGVGAGGDIVITTSVLEVLDGAQLEARTFNQGDAGDVIITASDRVTFAGFTATGPSPSGAVSTVGETGVGTGGNIAIATPVLEVLDGAQLQAGTRGLGNAGSVIITATESATFAGTGANGQARSLAASTVEETGIGAGNRVEITTPVLEVLSGAGLGTSTLGQGDAGNIIINATERVTFAGLSDDGLLRSSASSTVEQTGAGAGGNINITAPVLEVLNGAGLAASTSGRGNAGDVVINASEAITFDSGSAVGEFGSGALSTVESSGIGNGGEVNVTTPTLILRGGAQLLASTRGRGDAGNVIITATERVAFIGANSDSRFASGAASTVETSGIGKGGNVNITTPVLEMLDGAGVTTRTRGQGDAGRVIITATESVTISGTTADDGFSGGIFTNAEASAIGTGGPVTIDAPTLLLANGAVINARTENAATGGTIRIRTSETTLMDGGQIITTTLGEGPAGDIILNANRLRLSGRDLTFAARREQFADNVTNEGAGQSGLFSNARATAAGAGGAITVSADTLTLTGGAIISAQSDGSGTAGDIVLNAADALQLTDSDITTAALQSAGGDIRINTRPNAQNSDTTLTGDGDITTNSLGDGGNITIGGDTIFATNDSDIISRSDSARGGNITLTRFFSDPTPPGSAEDFDGNDQVDLNASGAIASGTIITPDTSFIQNSLADLPEAVINTESLITNSCVVRNEDGSSTFVVTGAEGLRDRPGDAATGYPTGAVESIPEDQSWQPGDPIVEPQGVYQLPNGELVLSHAC